MNWTQMLQLPATLLLIAAGVLLLLTIGHGVSCRRRWREGRRMAASWRALLLLLFFTLALLATGGGLALRGYRVLGQETPVATMVAHRESPQFWQLTLTRPDGETETLPLNGDDFRLEAVVVKWQMPAVLAGAPPLYRLDRLSGRYDDIGQARDARSTIIDLNQAGALDLFNLRRQYPDYLPMVDTVFGSGVYLPLVDGGVYHVSLMASGALVARPDAATKARLRGGH
ncbi:hypothetical protein [Oleiagrimonas soli]|uniref:Cation/multidrug efflux pump n=1 Tax=Oleiagrimonas soli TaxID=1543381 RepID=A0A099CZH1_9GAMM|nr:hypothetical protein [Oleiagrimonas soli]KGI79179.1 hypothetical protein LF63_0100610 [Oleiagrimonas soli]MBB6184773.1 hypothetical protein [Oleiagrimonas soli]